jgi:malonate decarboxylase delta subunit
MQKLSFEFDLQPAAGGTALQAIVGIVASGNLEVLLQRTLPSQLCSFEIATPVTGFEDTWRAVLGDFIARRETGGLRFSINDCGARPDVVALRLAQGLRLLDGHFQ